MSDLEAVDPGKANVDESEVRAGLTRALERLDSVRGLGHDAVTLALEQPPRRRAEPCVVVDD
jgi:hypothetical protein